LDGGTKKNIVPFSSEVFFEFKKIDLDSFYKIFVRILMEKTPLFSSLYNAEKGNPCLDKLSQINILLFYLFIIYLMSFRIHLSNKGP
jgi:hypothetical protein